MKIPFDIKFRPQIESGEYKLETECGHPVSIMDWEWIDRNEKKCLAVKVLMDEGFNIGYLFDYDGKRHSVFPSDSDSDLFIVTPEEELTAFEKRLFEIRHIAKKDMYSEQEWQTLRNESAELLSLAREQFIKDGYIIEKKAFHDAVKNISDKHRAEMSVEYSLHCKVENGTRHAVMNWEAFQKVAQKFIDIGKAEALKDLQENLTNNDIYRVPEWLREVLVMAKNNGRNEALKDLPRWGDNWDSLRPYKDISGLQYIVLNGKAMNVSNLTKLPGFNEDSHE